MLRTSVHRHLGVALAACLVGFGCSDDDSSATTTASGSGAGGQGATVTLRINILGVDGNRLEGVDVCEDDASPTNCKASDADGFVSLELPADSEVTLRMQKAGYMTRITPIEAVPNLHLLFYHVMVTAADMAEVAQTVGVTLDDSKGLVALSAISQDAPGVAATLSPPSGDGPFYYDSELNLVGQATEIPAGGGALFFNVDPGTPTVGFTPASAGCAFFDEAWGTDATTTPVPVEANTHTGVMDVQCQ